MSSPSVAVVAGSSRTTAPSSPAAISINLASYDSLLGRTYAEIGTEARSMHKCQGMAQLLALPGPAATVLQLVESALPGGLTRPDRNLYDGVDFSIAGLAQFAGPRPPRELTNGLTAMAAAVLDAQKRFDAAAAGAEDALDEAADSTPGRAASRATAASTNAARARASG